MRLASVVAEGQEEGRGEFVVAPERAREKSRWYRLARPQSFVLSLVQAACARGADRVEFAIDREDVRVYFGGRAFAPEELAELQRALFAPRRVELDAGLRALASAMAAVMALNPEAVRLLSGDAGRRAYLELAHDDVDLIEQVRPGKLGTWIHVHRRYRPGLSLEFPKLIEGHFAEVALLRERCRWAELPVLVNGEQVSQGLEIKGLVGRADTFSDGAADHADALVRGVVGIKAPATAPATVDILVRGVWIARHPLPEGFPPGFRARVDGSRLSTDATMRELVRDDSYARMLDVLGATRDRVLDNLARRLEQPNAPGWLHALLKGQLMSRWSPEAVVVKPAKEPPDDVARRDAVAAPADPVEEDATDDVEAAEVDVAEVETGEHETAELESTGAEVEAAAEATEDEVSEESGEESGEAEPVGAEVDDVEAGAGAGEAEVDDVEAVEAEVDEVEAAAEAGAGAGEAEAEVDEVEAVEAEEDVEAVEAEVDDVEAADVESAEADAEAGEVEVEAAEAEVEDESTVVESAEDESAAVEATDGESAEDEATDVESVESADVETDAPEADAVAASEAESAASEAEADASSDAPGDELLTRLAALPLWPASDGVRYTTRALLEMQGEIQYARATGQDAPLPEAVGTVFYLQGDGEAEFFTRALGERAIDVSRAIERERRYHESFEQWKERRHPPRLGSSYYLVRGTIDAEGVRGEVGLRGVGSERCTVRLIKDGCLLQQAILDVPVPGLDAVIEAGFTPNRSYNAAHRNDVLARAVYELLRALGSVMSELARAWVERPHDISEARALFMPYMFAVQGADFGINTLRAFGFAPGSAARHMRTLGGDELAPRWGLGDGEEPHPLARVEVFETCAGEGRSLVAIAETRRAHGTIHWLGVEHGPQRGVDEPVLWLTDEQHAALVSLFGEDALTDFSPQLDRLRRRAAFLDRPIEPLTLEGETLVQTSFERGTARGALGVARGGMRPDRLGTTRARVRVLKYGRFLGERRVPVLIPGLVGVVNDDEVPVDDEWSGLPEGDAPLALDAAVAGALPSLLQSAIDDCYAAQPGEASIQRLLLLRVPCAVFDHPQLLRVYTALRATAGDDESLEEYGKILALVATFSQSRVISAIERLLERGETPTSARIEPLLEGRAANRRDERGTSEERRARVEVRKQLLRLMPDVELAPLVRTTAGRMLSFAEILAVAREQSSLFYVADDEGSASASGRLRHYDGVERVITILDSAELHTLSRVLGAETLQSAAAWIEARERARDGVSRDDGGLLRLPAGERLVAVDVDDRDLSGQLGLRRWGPRADEPAMIRVGTPRGLSLTVFPESELPVIGALHRDDIALDFGIVEMNDKVLDRITAVVTSHTPALLEELARRWPELDSFELDAGVHWVLHILATRAPAKGVPTAAAAEKLGKDALARPLLELAAFACVDGRRRSLLELARAHEERGELRYVTEPWVHELPEFPVVVIDSDRLGELARLFPSLREHASEWQREQRIRKRRAQARRLPALPPRDALEATRVDTRGLSGWLWVMPEEGHEAKARLGHGGLEIERRALSELYPCEGALTVDSEEHVSREWDTVELSRRQTQALETASQQLFRELIETYEGALEQGQGAPVTLKGRTRRGLDATVDPSRVRVALAGLLIRLHAFRTDGRQRLKSSHRRIYRALAEMPLFTLANLRLISLNTALSERPSELSHLGFWKHEGASSGVPTLRNREMSTSHLAEELTELPQPTAAQRLLESVRAELRIVNSNAEDLLTEAYLDLLSIDHLSSARARAGAAPDARAMIGERDGYVVINSDHKVVQRAIAGFERDPLLVSVIASAVYSYFILWAEDLEPGQARAFITHHAGHVLSGVGA
ncbi:MAG: hypothetical protein H6713_34645 [Myxococcales bacterium]|nr:hypothetical protein [Myxococcales bacterium]